MKHTNILRKIGARENEVLKRFVEFIGEVREARKARGDREIQNVQVLLGKLYDLVTMYVEQQSKSEKVKVARLRVRRTQKLLRNIRAELSALSNFEQNLLSESLDKSNALEAVRRLGDSAQSFGNRKSSAIQNIASCFVIICIEHDWLPITVSNTVAVETKPSDHCRGLALVLDAAKLLHNVSNNKARSDLLNVKANSALRKLRSGFLYIPRPTPEQEEFGESFVYRASFHGRGYEFRHYAHDEWFDQDDDQIGFLPNFTQT